MNIYTASSVENLQDAALNVDGSTGTFTSAGAVLLNTQNSALIQLNPMRFTTSVGANLREIAISAATATTSGGTPTQYYVIYEQTFTAVASFRNNSVSYLLQNTSGAPLYISLYVSVRVDNSDTVTVSGFNYNAFFF
jgi:hypothetical protein